MVLAYEISEMKARANQDDNQQGIKAYKQLTRRTSPSFEGLYTSI
ncbi:hypothetical protein KSS87_002430 [Heliosperma pusillum]|nr:hypothetical protein KSS87_002430 [Heliosperma pusillum]